MPIFGSASRTKTSSQRAESARAIAQPTTPPPMITAFACSIIQLSRKVNGAEEISVPDVRHGSHRARRAAPLRWQRQKRRQRQMQSRQPFDTRGARANSLIIAADGVEIAGAGEQLRLRSVVHRIMMWFAVEAFGPERGAAVCAIFI